MKRYGARPKAEREASHRDGAGEGHGTAFTGEAQLVLRTARSSMAESSGPRKWEGLRLASQAMVAMDMTLALALVRWGADRILTRGVSWYELNYIHLTLVP